MNFANREKTESRYHLTRENDAQTIFIVNLIKYPLNYKNVLKRQILTRERYAVFNIGFSSTGTLEDHRNFIKNRRGKQCIYYHRHEKMHRRTRFLNLNRPGGQITDVRIIISKSSLGTQKKIVTYRRNFRKIETEFLIIPMQESL